MKDGMKVSCPVCGKEFIVSQGGRPSVLAKRGMKTRAKSVIARVKHKWLTLGEGAKELGIGKSTMKRLVDGTHVGS